ncbi:MAG: potassium transporter TrkA [Anaerolineaceae bacterium]|nr:MAG: potassium transporter TrkA [Anaerolineaceae bacterium]
MPQKYSFRQRFGYWFDNLMSRGASALIGGLALLTLGIIVLAALFITIGGRLLAPEGTDTPNFIEAAWLSLMRTLDAGTMGSDAGWGFRLIMLLVTIGGIFIVSTLIGVLSSGLESQIDRLRKGRSLVLENDHTVILGWTPQVFTIISELVIANENRKSGAVIVVMADHDKVEMEDAIRERVPATKNTRVICRSGSPIDLGDIEIVSPHTARSIIILPEGDDPDTHIIKSVLALTNSPNRREGQYHIVTQVCNEKSMDVLRMIGQRDIVQPVLTNDLIARVVAQTSRQSGLSVVYTELMNFGGDEIYFKDESALAGKTFGEALLAYEDSAVLGVRRADGSAQMNPPMDSILQSGDTIVAISADDDTIRLTSVPGAVDAGALRSSSKHSEAAPEKCLVLGWNRCGATIIRELDSYVASGSSVTVVSDQSRTKEHVRLYAGNLANQNVEVKEADTTDRAVLESLNIPDYDHVIALAYSHLEPQEADAKTLVTLLHLRDIAERDETPFSIVSEMLDLRNRELAEAANVDDFIVSEHLISLMMAQLSENRELLPVFKDIFDPEGAEIYLKPIGDYVATGAPVNFYTVTAAARQRGETAIGYRLLSESHDADKSYGVHTNPRKSASITFAPEDRVIVIAEE